ncbi:MAG: hypothetical protein H3C39_10805 [Flavobacteriia bacterium]|nr:hypothetical protein [Flavobacteriia bacterium]
MNKRTLLIILYILIVGASIYVTYTFYTWLMKPDGGSIINYALFIGFALFTYINVKRLLSLFRNRSK